MLSACGTVFGANQTRALQGRQSRVVLFNKHLEKFTILDCRAYGSQ
jgi:hypothetical protein